MKFTSPGRSAKSSGTRAHFTVPLLAYCCSGDGNPERGASRAAFNCFILHNSTSSLVIEGGEYETAETFCLPPGGGVAVGLDVGEGEGVELGVVVVDEVGLGVGVLKGLGKAVGVGCGAATLINTP